MAEYQGRVSVTYRHFPLKKHPLAQEAAEAGEAAGEQGYFWQMHDAIFANQNLLYSGAFRVLAGMLGLNMERYDEAIASGRPRDRVLADRAEGERIGVTFTPYLLLNGDLVEDTRYDALKQRIEQILKANR